MRSLFLTSHKKILSKLNNHIVKNTGWLFLEKILKIFGGLILGLWMAKYLGPENYGLLNYSIAFVALFEPLSTLGLHKIVVRDLVNQPERHYQILGTSFILRIFAGALIAVIAIDVNLWMRPDDLISSWLVAFSALGLVLKTSDIISFWFLSQVQAKQNAIAGSIAYTVGSTIRAGLLLVKTSVLTFGIASLLEQLIRSYRLGVSYTKVGKSFKEWKFNVTQAKALLKQSWPLILSGIAVTVYMHIDQVMLSQIAGNRAVGIYSVAVRLSESWYFIPVAIASSTFPMILAAKQQSQDKYYQQIHKLFKTVVSISYLLVVPLTLLAQPLVILLLGRTYSGAGFVLSIHVWSGIFVSLGVIRELWMTSENLMVFSFMTTVSGAVLNIILNYLLIPEYQEIGAAIATLLSYFLAAFLSCFIIRETRPIARLMASALILR
ncbi:flippase [Synechococcus sp. PCC 7336]|uniref:flippase n=1 Tax=Synechococcus sp. PCC 7336 TaxID=195250 RepID=UPI000373E774|nr:flippase [Synechococcus sp. PCC 7336]